MLHFAERRQIRHKQDAAADFFQHFLGQRATHTRQIQPGRTWRLERAGADFRHAASSALEQQHRRLGRRLFEPALEFLDEGRAPESVQRQWWASRRRVVLECLLHGRKQLLQRDRLLKEIERTEAGCLNRRINSAVA